MEELLEYEFIKLPLPKKQVSFMQSYTIYNPVYAA
jgi:hypothetical protein